MAIWGMSQITCGGPPAADCLPANARIHPQALFNYRPQMWLVGYAPGACLRGWLMELGHHSTEVAHGENGDVQEGAL
jgi:hypothetical protein